MQFEWKCDKWYLISREKRFRCGPKTTTFASSSSSKEERLFPRVIKSLSWGKTSILVRCHMTSCLGMHVICLCSDHPKKTKNLLTILDEKRGKHYSDLNWVGSEKSSRWDFPVPPGDIPVQGRRSEVLVTLWFEWNAHLPRINQQPGWFGHDGIRHGAWASSLRFGTDNEPPSRNKSPRLNRLGSWFVPSGPLAQVPWAGPGTHSIQIKIAMQKTNRG